MPVEQPKKLPAGAPVPPSFRSVLIRSLVASAAFFVVLGFSGGNPAGRVLLVVVMFLFLLGFGYLFDRWFYRWRVRRWERRRAGG